MPRILFYQSLKYFFEVQQLLGFFASIRISSLWVCVVFLEKGLQLIQLNQFDNMALKQRQQGLRNAADLINL